MGLAVFKTAGGSLGAVPGGFDSHTPLPVISVPNFVLSYVGVKGNSTLIVEKNEQFFLLY